MMSALQWVLLLAAVVLGVPVLVVLAQVVLACRHKPSDTSVPNCRPRIAVLVPAHNEEEGIGNTLACLKAQLHNGDRLVVVADNCTDGTAAAARLHGAEVCERNDPLLRGKGYALDCGVRFLADNPPDVLIIVDADCMAERGAIDILARRAADTGRPVQALYLMHSLTSEKLTSRIAEFAWIIKNLVRPLGWHRAGFPCHLMGTGMAFPWALIRSASIANGHLAEDMKLGIECALNGCPPLFCRDAVVTSHFPLTAEGAKSQRSRWEHGHMSLMVNVLPHMLAQSLKLRNGHLLAFAMDMTVPPLALLVLVAGALFMLSALAYLLAGLILPLATAVVLVMALGLAIALSWWVYGRTVISLSDLLLGVAYALGKIPLYIRFFFKRQVEWIRTDRKQ